MVWFFVFGSWGVRGIFSGFKSLLRFGGNSGREVIWLWDFRFRILF